MVGFCSVKGARALVWLCVLFHFGFSATGIKPSINMVCIIVAVLPICIHFIFDVAAAVTAMMMVVIVRVQSTFFYSFIILSVVLLV